jgi:prokaryotic ubiquitin-like protein Pup
MPSQEKADARARTTAQESDEEVVASKADTSSAAPSEVDADVDAILAEIDEVLEVNAEDFVKSFIQKGGQ